MTRAQFLILYEARLIEVYPWARDQGKLDDFMELVVRTLDGSVSWNFQGPTTDHAWKSIGGKGKPTLKALRALD